MRCYGFKLSSPVFLARACDMRTRYSALFPPENILTFYCSNHFLANSKSTQYPLNTFNNVFYPKAKDGEETGEDDFHSAPRILPRHFERGGTLGRCCFPVLLRSMGHCFQDGDHLALID